jgi:aspartate aminotransferase
MPALSELVQGMQQSGIRRIMNAAMTMEGVVRLEVGEPRFATPAHIVEAANAAALAGYTKYTANSGIPSLREAIAERVSEDSGLTVSPDRVGVTVGAVGAVYGAVRVLVDSGDEVLIPEPGWPNYRMVVSSCGAVPASYALRKEDGFLPTIEGLERALTPRTKILLINTPSNPLGTVFPADLMESVMALARRRDLWVISDEVYEKIIFNGKHTSACRFDNDGRVIMVSGFSKTYAMTGWRVGYAVAPPAVIAQLAKMQEGYVSCAPGPSQKAAEAALRGPQDCVARMCMAYEENARLATGLLDELGVCYHRPQGAFYLWVTVGCPDSMGFALDLLQQERVALAPGSTFGPAGEGYVRISLASAPEDIAEGIRRLARFMRRRSPGR